VSVLARRVTDLEKERDAASARADRELAKRKAEEAYANRTISELREEVRRHAERARGFQIELSKIELSRIVPLQAEAENLKAKALIAEQLTAFVEQVEEFTEKQARALGLKQRKRPKSPTLSDRIEWLGATLEDIGAGLNERAEKHRQRGETIEQQRKDLGALKTERAELQEALEKTKGAKEALSGRHAKELAAEATRRAALEQQLRDAHAEISSLKDCVQELRTTVKGLQHYRELAESLLEQQRAAREKPEAESAPKGASAAAEMVAVPSADPLCIFTGPKEELLAWLADDSKNAAASVALFKALIAHPEGRDLVRSTKQWLTETYEESLTTAEGSGSPRAVMIFGGINAFDSLLARAIEEQGAFNFLLKLPPDEAVDYVNGLSDPSQTMLLTLAAVNPSWSHGLRGRRVLALLDALPAGVRASLVEKTEDPELALLTLFGSNAVRQGITRVMASYRVKYGSRTDEQSFIAYRAKVGIADEHSSDPEILAAREALRAYLLLSEARQNFVWDAYPATKEGFLAARAVLGFDVRDAIALIGLQFDSSPQTGTPP
jgi:hypothetical protein